MFSVLAKLQTPSSKLQKNRKLQSPKPAWEARSTTPVGVGRFTRLERLVLVLGIWSFSGAWSLELGACSQVPAPPETSKDPSRLFQLLANFFERSNFEVFAQGAKLLWFKVAHHIDEHGFALAFQDGDDQAFHGFLATGLDVDADIFILFLHSDDGLPALGIEFGPDCFDFLLDLRAIVVCEAN